MIPARNLPISTQAVALFRRTPKKRDMTGYSASFCLHQIEAASGGNVFSGQP
jgi:hypothetical protein